MILTDDADFISAGHLIHSFSEVLELEMLRSYIHRFQAINYLEAILAKGLGNDQIGMDDGEMIVKVQFILLSIV